MELKLVSICECSCIDLWMFVNVCECLWMLWTSCPCVWNLRTLTLWTMLQVVHRFIYIFVKNSAAYARRMHVLWMFRIPALGIYLERRCPNNTLTKLTLTQPIRLEHWNAHFGNTVSGAHVARSQQRREDWSYDESPTLLHAPGSVGVPGEEDGRREESLEGEYPLLLIPQHAEVRV